MRPFAWIAAAALLPATTADARLFRQTFGATVPTAAGCAWNLNQDYFVPRHCDSCRYDLFSQCKTSHTRSAACKYLHPIYGGYCSPYGPCHYRWRDHVYKVHCGCTPLTCYHGPWRAEKCAKPCFALRGHGQCGVDGCPSAGCPAGDGAPGCEGWADSEGADVAAGAAAGFALDAYLPNVEPFGGEVLGSVAALPSGSLGGASGAAMPSVGGVAIPGASAARSTAAGPGGMPPAPGAGGAPLPLPLPLGY